MKNILIRTYVYLGICLHQSMITKCIFDYPNMYLFLYTTMFVYIEWLHFLRAIPPAVGSTHKTPLYFHLFSVILYPYYRTRVEWLPFTLIPIFTHIFTHTHTYTLTHYSRFFHLLFKLFSFFSFTAIFCLLIRCRCKSGVWVRPIYVHIGYI